MASAGEAVQEARTTSGGGFLLGDSTLSTVTSPSESNPNRTLIGQSHVDRLTPRSLLSVLELVRSRTAKARLAVLNLELTRPHPAGSSSPTRRPAPQDVFRSKPFIHLSRGPPTIYPVRELYSRPKVDAILPRASRRLRRSCEAIRFYPREASAPSCSVARRVCPATGRGFCRLRANPEDFYAGERAWQRSPGKTSRRST
jgi:hypothetical protein